MKLVGIDIGKNKHFFCIMDKDTSEVIVSPVSFSNNKDGFDFLIQKLYSNRYGRYRALSFCFTEIPFRQAFYCCLDQSPRPPISLARYKAELRKTINLIL